MLANRRNADTDMKIKKRQGGCDGVPQTTLERKGRENNMERIERRPLEVMERKNNESRRDIEGLLGALKRGRWVKRL